MSRTESRSGQLSAPISVRWVLFGVILALLLATLDNMVVSTALPTIVRELGGASELAWVIDAYTLCTAASTAIWGKLGDIYDRKTIFMTAIGVFLLGSALCGIAGSMPALIGFRALQGLGAGGIAVNTFALIGQLVTLRERGRYQGMSAAVIAIATVGGPVLGGFVTANIGWRWVFYLNVPIGLVCLAWCAVVLRVPRNTGRARIDIGGSALLAVGVAALILLASRAGSRYPWISVPTATLTALVVVAFAVFFRLEARAVEPVLPMRLFRSRNLAMSAIMAFAGGVIIFGASTFLSLFLQFAQHADPARSGLLLLPVVIPIPLVSIIAGRVMSRSGRYRTLSTIGFTLVTSGLVVLATVGPDTAHIVSSIGMVIVGCGLGATLPITVVIAQNSVPPGDLGVASATTTLLRAIGGALGVAVFGGVLAAHVKTAAVGTAAYTDAVGAATGPIFLLAAAIAALGTIAAIGLIEIPLRGAKNAS